MKFQNKKKFGTEMSHFIHLAGTETAAPKRRHRNGGTETSAPSRPASLFGSSPSYSFSNFRLQWNRCEGVLSLHLAFCFQRSDALQFDSLSHNSSPKTNSQRHNQPVGCVSQLSIASASVVVIHCSKPHIGTQINPLKIWKVDLIVNNYINKIIMLLKE